MHRRRFIEAAATASVGSALIQSSARARQMTTPGATPLPADDKGTNITLAERVSGVAPRSLLDALRTTAVTTPLFPADTPPIEPVMWDDTGDSDLDGTVGAVVFNTGYDEHDNYLAVGNAIVFADASAAERRFTGMVQATGSYLGMPWTVETEVDSAVSVLRIGYLIMVGGAELPAERMVDAPSEADPRQMAQMTARAIIRMTALTDHLHDVLSEIDD